MLLFAKVSLAKYGMIAGSRGELWECLAASSQPLQVPPGPTCAPSPTAFWGDTTVPPTDWRVQRA